MTFPGQFLGLVETRGYLTVCGDESERFLDYGYLKDNSKILYSTCKKKKLLIALVELYLGIITCNMNQALFWIVIFLTFSFFLPSTVERIEEINQYKGSVKLWPVDFDPSKFGKNFDPSKLDFEDSRFI